MSKTEDLAYVDGYDAFYEGVDRILNPYKMTTDLYGMWENGWLDACDYACRAEKEMNQ